MMHLRNIIVLSFSFWALSSLGATSSPAFTWQDCVKETAQNNPDVAVARAAVEQAEAQYSAAYSNFFPSLSFSAGYTESPGASGSSFSGSGAPTVSFAQGGGSSSAQGNYSVGLNANQSVFNGFQDYYKVRQYKGNLEAARAALALAKANAHLNLKNAFAQLLFQQQSVELSQSILERQNTNLRLVTLRFEGGQENKGNQLYQVASVAQSQYQFDHSVRQVRVAAKQLGAVLGRPDENHLVVEGKLTAKVPELTTGPELSTQMRDLALRHPSHTQAYYLQRAADAAEDIQIGGWYPDVNVSAYYGAGGSHLSTLEQRWSLGASISFPFFPGTSTIFGVQSARAARMQAENSLVSTDNKLIAALENAFGGLQDALQQVWAADQYVIGATARSKISREKYNTGLMTFEDWTIIETDLISRQQTLLQSRLGAVQAEATWENAQGKGDIL